MLPGELPIFSVSCHFIFTENKHGIAKLIKSDSLNRNGEC